MLKRFMPTQPDGSNVLFELPESYLGGNITIFINGQMLNCQDDTQHPYGFTVNEADKTFTFYIAPDEDDKLYVLYEYSIQLSFDNIDWTKKIRTIDFSSKVQKSLWEQDIQKTVWDSSSVPIVWDTKPTIVKWEQTVIKQNFTAKVHTKI